MVFVFPNFLLLVGSISWSDVQIYAAELFLGLKYLHDCGYVYRDLKPNNVMLRSDGHLCITDLGGAVKLNGQKITTAFGADTFRRLILLFFVQY